MLLVIIEIENKKLLNYLIFMMVDREVKDDMINIGYDEKTTHSIIYEVMTELDT